MAVEPEHAAGRLTFEDIAYYFCTLACARANSPATPNASCADPAPSLTRLRRGQSLRTRQPNALYGQTPGAYPWHDKSRTQPAQRLRPPTRLKRASPQPQPRRSCWLSRARRGTPCCPGSRRRQASARQLHTADRRRRSEAATSPA
jgi:hypothetical protein